MRRLTMSNIDREAFPRWTLMAAGVLIAVSIVGAGLARQARLNTPPEASAYAPPLASRDLRFIDTEAGAVEVREADTGALVHQVEPGEGGFIRGVMRGMARDRRAHGVGEAPPFRLAEWPDGRLSLEDLATGKQIELSAFGADNRRAFHRLLATDGSGA
jgi:putative photosynthetic complex assembly protein